jgi:gamma-glutamylcyclotransferase (GGCT)/AIG2-like uncharacterized protein YtfP
MVSRQNYLEQNSKTLIAIYDSLRKDMSLHDKLKNSFYLGEFISLPEYCLIDSELFPKLLKNGTFPIKIEIYSVDITTYNTLFVHYDYYHKLYPKNKHNLEEIKTPFGDAKIFIFNGKLSEGKIIESGDWKEHYQYRDRIPLKVSKINIKH